jgi:hypothetical protein
MKYSLVVTLNYPSFVKEATFSELSQNQMYEIAQGYLNDPEITSVMFVVVPLKENQDD